MSIWAVPCLAEDGVSLTGRFGACAVGGQYKALATDCVTVCNDFCQSFPSKILATISGIDALLDYGNCKHTGGLFTPSYIYSEPPSGNPLDTTHELFNHVEQGRCIFSGFSGTIEAASYSSTNCSGAPVIVLVPFGPVLELRADGRLYFSYAGTEEQAGVPILDCDLDRTFDYTVKFPGIPTTTLSVSIVPG